MLILYQLHKRMVEIHQLVQFFLGNESELSLAHLLNDSTRPPQVQIQCLEFGFGVFEDHGVYNP